MENYLVTAITILYVCISFALAFYPTKALELIGVSKEWLDPNTGLLECIIYINLGWALCLLWTIIYDACVKLI